MKDSKKSNPKLTPLIRAEDDARLKALGMERGTGNHVILEKPEHITRLGWLLMASLDYCRNDENFKKGKGDAPAA